MTNGILDSGQKIITDGLVLNYDIAQLRSYPTTGTTLTDLSGNSNNATLINGVAFDSGNGGNLIFDGVNDYSSINHSSSLNLTETFTISVWINPKRTNTSDYILNKNDVYSIILGYQIGYVNFYNGSYRPTAVATQISVDLNQWVNVVYSKNLNSLSNNWNGYKNGVSVFSLTNGFTNTISASPLLIGSAQIGLRPYNGNISQVQIYNRALTATEVLQNFNANRLRYGL